MTDNELDEWRMKAAAQAVKNLIPSGTYTVGLAREYHRLCVEDVRPVVEGDAETLYKELLARAFRTPTNECLVRNADVETIRAALDKAVAAERERADRAEVLLDRVASAAIGQSGNPRKQHVVSILAEHTRDSAPVTKGAPDRVKAAWHDRRILNGYTVELSTEDAAIVSKWIMEGE
jgi:hypothetical protein